MQPSRSSLYSHIQTPIPSLSVHTFCPSNDRGQCWTHAPPDATVTQSGELEREIDVGSARSAPVLVESVSGAQEGSLWGPEQWTASSLRNPELQAASHRQSGFIWDMVPECILLHPAWPGTCHKRSPLQRARPCVLIPSAQSSQDAQCSSVLWITRSPSVCLFCPWVDGQTGLHLRDYLLSALHISNTHTHTVNAVVLLNSIDLTTHFIWVNTV